MVAAGSGTRLGAAEPKALVTLGGLTILEHALGRVFDLTDAAQVVVVAGFAPFWNMAMCSMNTPGAAACQCSSPGGV